MNRLIRAASLSVALAVPRLVLAQGVADHLEVLQPPQLTACDDQRPLFRMEVSPVDVERRSVGVALGRADLRGLLGVYEGDRTHPVIYVGGPDSARAAGTVTMILLDTSGSMNARVAGETRFALARAAVRRSLGSFQDGVDAMAVVPFDSRNVVARITSATFQTTRVGVERQLDAIAAPLNDNNTAIYSSMSTALPMLKARADGGSPVSLVVFTDGENDVNHPGDDRGLLGADGLGVVKAMAAELRVPITTVGFGVAGNAQAQGALRELAWPGPDHYFDVAAGGEQLSEIFESTRRKLTDRMVVLFGPVREARERLSGQSVQFNVKLRVGDRIVSSRNEPLWQSPGVGVPVAEAECSTDEARAWLSYLEGVDRPPAPAPWMRVAIFVSLAAGLAALWFGAPRLVWPESYVPKPALPVVAMPAGVPQPPSIDIGRRPDRPAPAPPPAPRTGDQHTVQVPRPPARPSASAPPRPPRPEPGTPEPPRSRGGDATVYIPPPRRTPGDPS